MTSSPLHVAGTEVLADDRVRFSVWAPRPRSVELVLTGPRERRLAMERDARSVHHAVVADLRPGQDYCFLLDGERRRPDPRSRHQPHGVHGASRLVDVGAFGWSDDGFVAPPLRELVLYELHVGTFTAAGSFDGVVDRLAHLRDLGVNAVELMPVAAFPGRRNWGYDGVSLYAPQDSYGGPAGLARLVDACHAAGLAVVLDVVYNHLGPEGNYLGEYAPYFSDAYRTPWGLAINFDGPDSDEVRAFVVDNALAWVRDYHIDALRLDAVHGIFDQSARHVLEELATRVHEHADKSGRRIHVIAESDLNAPRVIRPVAAGGFGMDAQWSDDFHHAAHAALTGERAGYFGDFAPLGSLAVALEQGFVYQGQHSAYRRRRHGAPLGDLGGERLVVCTQNHDQIPNASHGRRLGHRVEPALERLAAALLLITPNLPMLFQGQEFGAHTPFLYFTDHGDPELAAAVTRGRREEHEAFGGELADPQDEATFASSRLDWSCLQEAHHGGLLALYRDLLALRRRCPALGAGDRSQVRATASEAPRWLRVLRRAGGGAVALAVLNFEPAPVEVPVDPPPVPLRLALRSDAATYGGAHTAAGVLAELRAGVGQTVTCPAHAALLYVDEGSGT